MPIRFDRFVLDSERRELLDGTERVHLGPKAFALLEILVAANPRAISKQELYQKIWPDTYVDESNLAGLITELRTALGDERKTPRFIRTVHGFGYAFCCETAAGSEPAPAGFLLFRGREIPLGGGVNVLGRDAAVAGIVIDDPTVSRRHATITIEGDGVTITDLESKNGTFLDGVQLAGSAPLANPQTFVLGDVSIVFRRTPAAGSTVTISRARARKA